MKRAWFILVWAVLVAGRGQCEPNEWRSPLFVRNAEPLNMLFLQAPPVSACLLPPRQARVSVGMDVVNHLLFDRSGGSLFEQDFEVQRVTIGYAVDVGGDWEVAVSLPVLARDGGFLDEAINVWHRLFGFWGGGRSTHRNYQVHERIVRNGQMLVSLDEPALGLGDVTVEARRLLGRSGRSFWLARAMLKLPTGSPSQQFGSGAVDAGLGIALSYQSSKNLVWHLNLSRVWVGKPANLSARDMVQWVVAVEYMPDARTSLVVQVDDNRTPVVVGAPYADGARRSLTVGIAREIRPGLRAELSVTENQFGWLARIAPDFHLHFGLIWYLKRS